MTNNIQMEQQEETLAQDQARHLSGFFFSWLSILCIVKHRNIPNI